MQIKQQEIMPGPGFEPGLLRPQRSVLTTRRSRRAAEEVDIDIFTSEMKTFADLVNKGSELIEKDVFLQVNCS